MALQYDGVAALRAEVGVLLLPAAQGMGVASAAIAALADVVFTASPLETLWTRHGHAHAAAAALMRRVGFESVPCGVDGEGRWQLTRARWSGLRAASVAPGRTDG
jgi:RimJ/RimL family protein N-acetyltransferase